MRVIVCGGRNYAKREFMAEVIRGLAPETTVVHGAAPGADTLAGELAKERGLAVEEHPADWKKYGRSAGPLRNREMLAAGAELVVAFPGGAGTGHMLGIAREAGLMIQDFSADPRAL